jgi:chemotaxis protein CheX
MSADASMAARAQKENWLPILELSVQEVFEIMLSCRLEPAAESEQKPAGDCTAMVGLAGALCGILTMSCGARSANLIAARMLGGDVASAGEQAWDALGEVCNMIAGNFKNKISGADSGCMLSVPTVIAGAAYSFHSLADGASLETTKLFEGAPVVVRLELHS